MFELARLGFLLLGLYLALSPLDDLAGSLITVDGEKLVAAAIAIPIWLVLAFVPGLVLIWKSRALAERLFGPPEDGSGRFEAETVVGAGLAVCGVWMVLDGVAFAISAVGVAMMSGGISGIYEMSMVSGVRGLFLVVLGIFLTIRSMAIAAWLANRRATPAA